MSGDADTNSEREPWGIADNPLFADFAPTYPDHTNIPMEKL
jgi:hypothetical protein